MEFYLHKLIFYILSYFLPSVQKDLNLQKQLDFNLQMDNNNYDSVNNVITFEKF